MLNVQKNQRKILQVNKFEESAKIENVKKLKT